MSQPKETLGGLVPNHCEDQDNPWWPKWRPTFQQLSGAGLLNECQRVTLEVTTIRPNAIRRGVHKCQAHAEREQQ
jgi:hypothetical protein